MINPDHLKTEIASNLGKYTQSFEVAAWLNGSRSQPDTAVPGKDVSGWTVGEFKALNDEAVRDALEPVRYGLMGSNAIERGWGEYQALDTVQSVDPMGVIAGGHA